MDRSVLRGVDALLLRVPSLDRGLAFYVDELGQELLWRKETMAAVRLGGTELVLTTMLDPEVDLLVESVPEALRIIGEAGGRTLVEPRRIDVGWVAVVSDPFGNALTLVDLSSGRYRTDPEGTVTGVQ